LQDWLKGLHWVLEKAFCSVGLAATHTGFGK
jgi:hypothetical protein